jgi:hypothetical protein
MEMTMEHPTADQFQAYEQGLLSWAEAEALEAHAAHCGVCHREWMARMPLEQALTELWAGICAGADAEPLHITDAELAKYARGRLRGVERQFVADHLECCAGCTDRLHDLQAAQQPPFLQRNSKLRWLLLPFPARLATAITVMLVLIASVQILRSRARWREELSHYPPVVQVALESQRVNIPTGHLKELKGAKPGRYPMMGDQGRGDAFHLVSPVGMIVATTQPTLSWTTLPDATNYLARIFDPETRQLLAQSQKSAKTTWRPRLVRGKTYRWEVLAYQGERLVGHALSPTMPFAQFQVLDEPTARAIETHHSSSLTLGVLYAQAGLLDGAQHELEKAAKANPNQPAVRKLLSDVQKAIDELK